MLNHIVDNLEQCGQQNIVQCCFHQARTGCSSFVVHSKKMSNPVLINREQVVHFFAVYLYMSYVFVTAEWHSIYPRIRSRYKNLTTCRSLSTRFQQVMFILLVLRCQQVWNNLLTTCNMSLTEMLARNITQACTLTTLIQTCCNTRTIVTKLTSQTIRNLPHYIMSISILLGHL